MDTFTFINRDQIAAKVAAKTGLKKYECKEYIFSLEAIILDQLKLKQRVRVNNFGTFYLHLSKSHHITQIRSKSRRLLLEQTLIKFRAATEFKRILNGERPSGAGRTAQGESENGDAPLPGGVSPNSSATPDTLPPTSSHPTPYTPPPTPSRPTPHAPIPTPYTPPPTLAQPQLTLDQTAAGKTFGAIFKHIQNLGNKSINFVVTESENCHISSGRPRQALAAIPTKLVRDFLAKYFEIDDFSSPQFRFVKLHASSKMGIGYHVEVHTLPTADGASVNLKIS